MIFTSRFGGLWTDAVEALEIAEAKLGLGAISREEFEQLKVWIEFGYVIIRGAVSQALVESVNGDVDSAWEKSSNVILAQSNYLTRKPIAEYERRHPSLRLLDFYVHSQNALRLVMAPSIERFLRIVFDEPPLIFQSLTFEVGSGQGMHNDTAYVVVDAPNHLAAAWVALEDTKPGSGELTFYPGSHRFEERLFSGHYKNWRPDRDGEEQHEQYIAHIHSSAQEKGIEPLLFQAKAGDAFIWAANLAHGGSEITDSSLTRKSMVGHYCPASVRPAYFTGAPELARTLPATSFGLEGLGCISSEYYQIA